MDEEEIKIKMDDGVAGRDFLFICCLSEAQPCLGDPERDSS